MIVYIEQKNRCQVAIVQNDFKMILADENGGNLSSLTWHRFAAGERKRIKHFFSAAEKNKDPKFKIQYLYDSFKIFTYDDDFLIFFNKYGGAICTNMNRKSLLESYKESLKENEDLKKRLKILEAYSTDQKEGCC